ncbi:MAG: Fic family protein [Bryobacterales bacterium]|nr:Fic family protein [Bryobacterales bacterium]
MARSPHVPFSGPVTSLLEQALPERATPAGYAALIDAYSLRVPHPRTLFATGGHHRIREASGWRILTPRHAPAATLEGHLTFALRYEGVDLAVLKRLFLQAGPKPIESLVSASPNSKYAQRLWFLYEWLLGRTLDLPDARTAAYVPALDPARQFSAAAARNSSRHRVRINLPGSPQFCPLVFRTPKLDNFIGLNLDVRAQAAIAAVPRDILARTAALLLLKDSKSSYAIEGERAPQDRIQRWGRAIGQAGRHPLSVEELLRLQAMVIGDARFVKLGLRQEGSFVGDHDRDTRAPLPDHISAHHQDLPSLLEGLLAFDHAGGYGLDPVLAAAVSAFAFVYIHPFADGNGRLHRYLIHHVLASRGFHPPGIVFPISAAILDGLPAYRAVLEDYSRRLLPAITWKPTMDGNVDILNDTADFYRFFDATPHAEFLFDCVRRTIEVDLPRETAFLESYDQFRSAVAAIADMPDRTADLLFRLLRQNNGQLSTRARAREFAALTDDEAAQVEQAYQEAFPPALA